MALVKIHIEKECMKQMANKIGIFRHTLKIPDRLSRIIFALVPTGCLISIFDNLSGLKWHSKALYIRKQDIILTTNID